MSEFLTNVAWIAVALALVACIPGSCAYNLGRQQAMESCRLTGGTYTGPSMNLRTSPEYWKCTAEPTKGRDDH